MTQALTPAQRILSRANILATFSESEDALCRRYLVPQHQQANTQVAHWMAEAGMVTWQDGAGNQWGRYPADPTLPALILGSHLDTVSDAGRYDGMLGVLSAIEVVQQLAQANRSLPFAVEVVGFGDEEGVRFGTTLLGSAAVAGQWDPRWFELKDENGTRLETALETFGSSRQQVMQSARNAREVLAFLELHIEQGPVLEQAELPVGVVTAIAGAKRLQFTVSGQAGHAGTVPMDLRRDSLCGAALMISAIERIAREQAVVATVGRLAVAPDAVNVIPGQVQFSLDIRAGDDAQRDKALAAMEQALAAIAASRQLTLEQSLLHQACAVQCDPDLQQALAQAIEGLGYPALRLPSGAGHDAMMMANLTRVGMLFVRCRGGISHNPAEQVSEADVAAGTAALQCWVEHLAEPGQITARTD